ncbi:uncharacterized protein PAN0_133d6788 [Moesziomyces antarcticus]|uniref:Uncharacterized protein n=1 Tax=Pseudozyma antarctica TaxID=84753 RepID=A0A081CPD0_PSEA2|nr:uncharacterized protein PAN0_133d6788 [Moesziomyces antarcticus]GAK68526.1 hypothetical protein PAN0_133d6788 [Moesziomyces antarcticus]
MAVDPKRVLLPTIRRVPNEAAASFCCHLASIRVAGWPTYLRQSVWVPLHLATTAASRRGAASSTSPTNGTEAAWRTKQAQPFPPPSFLASVSARTQALALGAPAERHGLLVASTEIRPLAGRSPEALRFSHTDAQGLLRDGTLRVNLALVCPLDRGSILPRPPAARRVQSSSQHAPYSY